MLFIAQNVLNGGEISPRLSARFDQPRYQTGCRRLLNAVPMPAGGVTRRPGFIHCGPALEQKTGAGGVRLAPFVFSASQARMLEFGPGSMRVWLPDGRLVAKDGEPFVLATPYTAEDVASLSVAQSADVLFIASRRHPPAKISRHADDDWRYAALAFMPGIQPPAILSVTGSGAGGGAVTNYSYVATSVDKETGEESNASAEVSLSSAGITSTYSLNVAVSAVPGALEYRVYRRKAGVFGFVGRIDATAGSLVFTDNIATPDDADTPPKHENPFAEAGSYPGLVFLHQQRLGWASSEKNPLTVWLSPTGNYESMAASTPPQADDAITVALASSQANRIVWAQPDRDSLGIGTEGGEWVLSGADGGALTPDSLVFQPQSAYGGEPGLQPVTAGTSVLFVQRGGFAVREFRYSFEADRYDAQDLTILARHILQDKSITAWAYQQEPYSVVWCALSDGSMAGLTFMRDQAVVGWQRHATDGFVEHVAAMPGTPDDAVWIVVRRGGTRRIERMAAFFESDDNQDAFFVDAGLSGMFAQGVDVIGGLDHLEGREVAVFCDGFVHPPRVVADGEIHLDQPVRRICAGLPYVSDIVPDMPETSLQDGTTLLRLKRVTGLAARVHQSMSFKVSCDNGKSWHNTKYHGVSGARIEENPWFAADVADISLPLDGAWSGSAWVRLRVDEPVPATVLALTVTCDVAPMAGGE